MEAASRLRHERCVRAYDFGGDSDHVYIAYEYVQGRTMREALRGGKLGDRDAVEAAAQILDALAHAHRLGIVHRDVKPSNVLVEEAPTISIRLLDFGLAQFDEADTLTAVGDVPGTLAYIAPERLRGGDATARKRCLGGRRAALGVARRRASVLGRPSAPGRRGDRGGGGTYRRGPHRSASGNRRRRLVGARDRAVATPFRGTSRGRSEGSARIAPPRSDEAFTAEAGRACPKAGRTPASLPLERRLVPAALAAVTVTLAATLLPFWTPGLVLLLALAAGGAMLRAPRLGLAIALFVPVFPLGNIAQAAAVAYAAVAAAWLALCWRDARAGLLFVAGPLLASVGALALLPLAVQPARGRLRRALHAFAGVLAATAVAGLRGQPLPLTGAIVPNLGIDGSTRVTDVLQALVVLEGNAGLIAVALVLALASALLPDARRRGLKGIAVLGACQIGLILALAPALPALSIVLGTGVLCAALAALSLQSGRYP